MTVLATIYVGDRPAATLSREPDGVTLYSYLPDYLADGALELGRRRDLLGI